MSISGERTLGARWFRHSAETNFETWHSQKVVRQKFVTAECDHQHGATVRSPEKR